MNFNRAQDLFDHIAFYAGGLTPARDAALDPFASNESHAFFSVDPDQAPMGSGAKGSVKRFLRKCIGWYVRPPFHTQQMVNAFMTRSMREMNRAIADLSSQLETLSAKLDPLLENRKTPASDHDLFNGGETEP